MGHKKIYIKENDINFDQMKILYKWGWCNKFYSIIELYFNYPSEIIIYFATCSNSATQIYSNF